MVESQIKMRREVEVQTRRQVIVDATRRLVAERGIEAASMDEIAAAVQYTRRTLYARGEPYRDGGALFWRRREA